jgi:Fe-Mn family superoxide dismutase
MIYEIKKYESLLGLPGISDALLKNHFSLYEGYVKNVNILMELTRTIKVGSLEHNELRRRFAFEWNGMRLHELYFENLTAQQMGTTSGGLFEATLVNSFGSYEKWLEDFKTIGMTRGVGWVALVKDKQTNFLMNIWIGEHEIGHLANEEILLVMDVWEHAYMIDNGIKRADYIDKFIPLIDWRVVESRY